jgi:hypothetical protein
MGGAILLVVTLALFTQPSSALVVRELSFDELVVEAGSIYRGRVVKKRVAWNESRTLILTHYTLSIRETLKGTPGAQVRFSELGGEIDGVALDVPGAPEYRLDEEVVVFLHAEKGRVMTLNWRRGKFPVERMRNGESRVVMPASRDRPTTEAFTRRVRNALDRGGGGP